MAHLQHPHIWVRLVSAQVFGMVFAAYEPEDLASIVTNEKVEEASTEYLLLDTLNKVLLYMSRHFS